MLDSRAVTVVGAGVAGTWQALLFAKAGFAVTLCRARRRHPCGGAPSYWAGGMLAPGLRGRDGGADRHAPRPALPRAVARAWAGHARRTARSSSPIRATAPITSASPASPSGYERVDARAPRARSSRRWPAASAKGCSSRTKAHVEPRHVLPALHRQLEAARRDDPLRRGRRAAHVSTAPSSTAAASRRATSFPICAACAARPSWSRPHEVAPVAAGAADPSALAALHRAAARGTLPDRRDHRSRARTLAGSPCAPPWNS